MTADFLTLQEMVMRARAHLSRNEWDYLVGGAETETTLKRNRLAFERLALKARVLQHDVSSITLGRRFLGVDLRMPVILAPIGSIQVFEPGGGLSVARAAGTYGTMQVLSSVCQPGFEEIARESDAPKVYQFYAHGDEAEVFEIADRAKAAGYLGLCLTVDTQVYSRRERDILKRYIPRSGTRVDDALLGEGAATLQPSFSWPFVDRLKARMGLPLILKGIACAEDAAIALDHGVDVIYVSNHGGRQLDQGRGALDMLPEVVDAVAGRATIVVDGGIVRGTDVLKALAVGADVVGIGRLQGFAMAAGGVEGVVRMLELLENEIRINLALAGLSSIDQLDPGSVLPAEPVVPPHVLGAFPLMDQGY